MAPPNRGSSKANNTSRFTSTSSSSTTTSTSTSSSAFNRSITPNSSLYINDPTTTSSSNSSFPSLTIPYNSYQDNSQQNIFAYNPPSDSTYPGVFGSNSNNNGSSLDFGGSTFSSPASPSPQYLADPSSTLGPLFQSDINPGLMSGFEDSYTMYTDPAPPSSRKSSVYSTSTSSSSRHGSTDLSPFPSFSPSQQGYPSLSLARGHPKLSNGGYLSPSDGGDHDMDTDLPPPLSAGSGYVYNFSEIPGSPQDPDELEDELEAPSLAVPTSNKGNSYLKSTSSSNSYYAPSSKEKEQNKQKLYRNRKSEFTNRMRDELLAMNLLPHSRVTHAPEIMSKTADTLRDYRELLIMIKDSVDGMPENLASVPGAVRKMLNEKGQMFNAPPPQQQRRAYTNSTSTKGHVNVPNSAAMPIGYGAMQRGF